MSLDTFINWVWFQDLSTSIECKSHRIEANIPILKKSPKVILIQLVSVDIWKPIMNW